MSHKRAACGPPTPPKVSQRLTRAGAGVRLAGASPQQVSEDDDVHDHHRWHVEDGEVIGDAEIRWIDVILEGGDVYDDVLRPLGLRVTQFNLLAVLTQTGPIAITALADLMGMERSALARNLKPIQ